MTKTRVWLVIFSLLMIASFILMSVIAPAIQKGRMPDDLIGVMGILLTISYLACIIITFRYAQKTGRHAGLYALGAFLLPGIIPLILAFLPAAAAGVEITTAPGKNEFSFKDEKGGLHEKYFSSLPSPPRQFRKWHLDRLRLFCVVLPHSSNWRVVSSSEEFSFNFPDLMSPDDASELYALLDELSSGGNSKQFTGIKLALADFQENGELIDLRKISSTTELLSGLYHFRDQRKESLKEWLETNPQVTLRGGFGASAKMDQAAYSCRKISLSWPEVSRIDTDTINGLITHMYVLPENHSGGMFDFGKGKYSLPNIPTSKKALYVAEVQFWKSLCSNLSV